MSRTVQDAKLSSREARSKLAARGRPYWRAIEEGVHLGYRKPRGRRGRPAGAGKWIFRHYVGGTYRSEKIETADDFTDADGVHVLNFTQAQNRVRELHLAHANSAAGISGPLTVAAALESYFEHLDGQGRRTTDQRYHVAAHVSPQLGTAVVSELTTKALTNWLHTLAKLPPRVRTSPGANQQHRAIEPGDAEAVRRRRASANRIWTTFRAALNHAWRQGLAPSDTAWRRVKPFHNVESARVRYLTIAESQRLINAADAEFRPLVVAALASGCRYQELARLKVADFNPDAGTLSILVSKSGRPRHVTLTEEGAKFCASLCAGKRREAFMLARSDGTQWGRSHQQLKMQAACKRAKIAPAIGFHILRHTWASLAIMSGMPLQVAAHNLGHADTKMVERHYGHLSKSFVTDAIRAHAPRFGIAKSNVTVLR